MDPDEALAAIRELVEQFDRLNKGSHLTTASQLTSRIQDLDDWLSRGGFSPAAWVHPPLPARHYHDPDFHETDPTCPHCRPENSDPADLISEDDLTAFTDAFHSVDYYACREAVRDIVRHVIAADRADRLNESFMTFMLRQARATIVHDLLSKAVNFKDIQNTEYIRQIPEHQWELIMDELKMITRPVSSQSYHEAMSTLAEASAPATQPEETHP